MKAWRVLLPILVLGVGACGDGGGPVGDHVLARAAGLELTAQEAAEILAPQPDIPPDPQVIEALADLWVQYYLLASAVAQDSTLLNIDLESMVRQQVEGELVAQLRDQVIQVDTAISEEVLRARFEAEAPGGSVRARHILLQFPDGASDAQADSVWALAESLRSRILGGESFEEMARQFSQDTGTAPNGGDLGSFGRNEMVPPFEAAAYSLPVGEVSEVVETAFGLHIIKVEERTTPMFEELRDQFRLQLQSQLVVEAESTYVADLIEAANLESSPDGLEAIKGLAGEPRTELTSRALNRSLVDYRGGALTLGEFRDWLLTSAPTVPGQILTATDEQLDNLLLSLTQSELLVMQANEEGLAVPSARQDSLAEGIRTGVKGIAQQLGFFQIVPRDGESPEEAADRVVREVLVQVVQEGREIYPLQTVAYALKEQFGGRIYSAGVARTVDLVNELRLQGPAAPISTQPTTPPDSASADTMGAGG